MRVSAVLTALAVVGSTLVTSGSVATPQRGQRGQRSQLSASGLPWRYDGAFIFCRVAFGQSMWGNGGSWMVDYPKADLNFPFRLGELTTTPISRDSRHEPNHVVVTLTDPNLFQCPFVMMTEVGAAGFAVEEAKNLRAYLEKGGFLWADDFWGERAWNSWEDEISRVLPSVQYPIVELPLDHPIFRMQYLIKRKVQIPSINFWLLNGQTSERGYESAEPHVRAILNARGHVMVLMTHNSDFGDAWEREGENQSYFEQFATDGYAFGINVYLYAMTH